MMMIAALRIIKDPSTENDRDTHGDQRNNASQYPDHCCLPWFLFSTHDSTLSFASARIADEPFRDHVFAH
jgi:hypothetical protein